RAPCRLVTPYREEVLRAPRDAMQGTAILAARDLLVGRARLRARPLLRQGDHTLELRIETLQPREVHVRQLAGFHFARAQELGQLSDRKERQILERSRSRHQRGLRVNG